MSARSFHLDKANGKLMGVCAGVADFMDIDVLWVRVGWIAAMFVAAGLPLVVYLAIGFLADSGHGRP